MGEQKERKVLVKNYASRAKKCGIGLLTGLGIAALSLPIVWGREIYYAIETGNKKSDLKDRLSKVNAEESYNAYCEKERQEWLAKLNRGEITGSEYDVACKRQNFEQSYWDYICSNKDDYAEYVEEYNEIMNEKSKNTSSVTNQGLVVWGAGMGISIASYFMLKNLGDKTEEMEQER